MRHFKQCVFEKEEHRAEEFTTRVSVYECCSSLLALISYSTVSHIKVPIIHFFFLLFSPNHQSWMEKDDRGIAPLSDKWQDGITLWASHWQTAATEEMDKSKCAPLLQFTELAHLRDCSHLRERGMERHLL